MDAGQRRKNQRVTNRLAVLLAALALLAAVVAGCVLVRDAKIPKEWEPLLEEIRVFERRIGFEDPEAFIEFSEEDGGYPFCGRVSRLYLPYSYEDPEIRWLDVESEQECRAVAEGTDVYFGTVEALGEVGAAVTSEMLGVPLHRFIYLVIHEDCHEQFAFPYGIEEALCNLIAYKGMAAFSAEKYGLLSRENIAIQRYASVETGRTRTVKGLYEDLAGHYARYEKKEISPDALLKERARILSRAERALRWKRGSLNNVGMANEMTYSRHYPLFESVYDAHDRDLARTMAFFKRVDALKPPPREVMKKHRITTDQGLSFVRAYEAEIVETVEKALAEAARR